MYTLINSSHVSDPRGTSLTGGSTIGQREPDSSVDVRSSGLVGGEGDDRGRVWGPGTVCGERDVG